MPINKKESFQILVLEMLTIYLVAFLIPPCVLASLAIIISFSLKIERLTQFGYLVAVPETCTSGTFHELGCLLSTPVTESCTVRFS